MEKKYTYTYEGISPAGRYFTEKGIIDHIENMSKNNSALIDKKIIDRKKYQIFELVPVKIVNTPRLERD